MIYFINLKHYFNLGKSQVEGKFAIVGYVPYGKVNIYIYFKNIVFLNEEKNTFY